MADTAAGRAYKSSTRGASESAPGRVLVSAAILDAGAVTGATVRYGIGLDNTDHFLLATVLIEEMANAADPMAGEVREPIPDLQGWTDAHRLALSQPANTQPAQSEDGASGGIYTTLVNSPETPLGFTVLSITLPSAVTPKTSELPESTTFLLPYTEGQVEAPPLHGGSSLLTTRVVLTTSTSRDLISLQRKLTACPIFFDCAIERIEWGPGGNAPINWCHAHGITDPLSVLEVSKYYYDHFESTTDLRAGLVHLESVYSEKYGPWNPLQIQQPIKGEEDIDSLTLAQDNASSTRAAESVKLMCSTATVNGTLSEAI